jgi:hypothetical protein
VYLLHFNRIKEEHPCPTHVVHLVCEYTGGGKCPSVHHSDRRGFLDAPPDEIALMLMDSAMK